MEFRFRAIAVCTVTIGMTAGLAAQTRGGRVGGFVPGQQRPPGDAAQIARGKAVKIPVRVERKNGFIGKILGEMIAPGGVVGLQARGVAFESQIETAEVQVVATEKAPLGRHALLRLEVVGMWEDQAVCRATRFVELEITE